MLNLDFHFSKFRAILLHCWGAFLLAAATCVAQDFNPSSEYERRADRISSRQASWDEGYVQQVEPIQSEENSSLQDPKKEPVEEKEKETAPEKPKEEKKVEAEPKEEKEKKWFEKLSIRGYGQFRYNSLLSDEPGSASQDHAGDSSIANDQEFSIRRARVILYGDVSDYLYVYLQPDFAASPDGVVSNFQFTQLRDWYADVYLDSTKVHRLRIGQSKIPYGWENLQSSQNRLSLDRNDAFNSATKNERDLGAFYYWTPEWAQDTFKYIMDEGLKGSGNYGLFGFGAYNGQGGSLREFNDELHLVARFTLPYTFENGQIIEAGIQGYTGRYVVLGAPIAPLGVGPAITPNGTRGQPSSPDGHLDQRLGWSFNYYPQPFGIQAEYTLGRGPELNAAQTAIERGYLHGGYLMFNYRYQSACYGDFLPFVRYQYYEGGYKNAANAPASSIDEWNFGIEWQIRKEMELVGEYLITDRTNLRSQTSGVSYGQFAGHLLRVQFQVNF
jgi:Phosphate-selective porin O and P